MNSPFLKAIAPALLTLIAVGALYVGSGELDRTELAVGATGIIGSTLVYFTTNVPGWPFLKALVPAVTGSLAAVAFWIETGTFDRAELTVFLTALGTAVVAYFAPNVSSDRTTINQFGSEVGTAGTLDQQYR